jgi:hypothetical protein
MKRMLSISLARNLRIRLFTKTDHLKFNITETDHQIGLIY